MSDAALAKAKVMFSLAEITGLQKAAENLRDDPEKYAKYVYEWMARTWTPMTHEEACTAILILAFDAYAAEQTARAEAAEALVGRYHDGFARLLKIYEDSMEPDLEVAARPDWITTLLADPTGQRLAEEWRVLCEFWDAFWSHETNPDVASLHRFNQAVAAVERARQR